jgi:hypothetical protein
VWVEETDHSLPGMTGAALDVHGFCGKRRTSVETRWYWLTVLRKLGIA